LLRALQEGGDRRRQESRPFGKNRRHVGEIEQIIDDHLEPLNPRRFCRPYHLRYRSMHPALIHTHRGMLAHERMLFRVTPGDMLIFLLVVMVILQAISFDKSLRN